MHPGGAYSSASFPTSSLGGIAGRRGGLGRGLGALIPTGPLAPAPAYEETVAAAVPGATLQDVLVDAITPNPRQPRRSFDEEALQELAESIAAVGLLQPVVVREVAAGRYELVMGERRWRASQRAGLSSIPAIIRETGDDAMLRDALLENLHRQQLNPLEEAAAYQQLLEDFGATHDQLAARLGRSRPQITNTLRLLQLPTPVQRRVAAGVLSAGHARALLALDDPAQQDEMAARIVAEGVSVRGTEELVAVARGNGQAGRARSRRPSSGRTDLPGVATALADRLDTRVKVELGRSKGRIVIEFASVDDLERIVGVMSPGALPTGSPDLDRHADSEGVASEGDTDGYPGAAGHVGGNGHHPAATTG